MSPFSPPISHFLNWLASISSHQVIGADWTAHGPWRLSASPALYFALPNKYFRDLGLPEVATR